jgi:hypothetical protein
MRARTEWWIFKNYPTNSDYWDGPHKTEAEANRTFNERFRVKGRVQDFVVVKLTLTPKPTPKERR